MSDKSMVQSKKLNTILICRPVNKKMFITLDRSFKLFPIRYNQAMKISARNSEFLKERAHLGSCNY